MFIWGNGFIGSSVIIWGFFSLLILLVAEFSFIDSFKFSESVITSILSFFIEISSDFGEEISFLGIEGSGGIIFSSGLEFVGLIRLIFIFPKYPMDYEENSLLGLIISLINKISQFWEIFIII